ncbi:MAG: 30S ribosomal protein S3 [Deltaproteobacteria bacterium]|nr:MAG: 30S ribosomal protein S3 [Deltaproteobacteria bacterium]
MGQKVHPTGFRLGVIKTWSSKWYAGKEYARLLHEDLQLRKVIKKKLYQAGILDVEIERSTDKVKINILAARPGMIIGKGRAGTKQLKETLSAYSNHEIFINIQQVRRPEVEAQLIAEDVALQLERRVAFRRAMKKSISTALKFGVKGIKIAVAGRLGGAEMARRERYLEGRVPLHTLRADIDYGFAQAKTTYGVIGVKVWIFKGEVLPAPPRHG